MAPAYSFIHINHVLHAKLHTLSPHQLILQKNLTIQRVDDPFDVLEGLGFLNDRHLYTRMTIRTEMTMDTMSYGIGFK